MCEDIPNLIKLISQSESDIANGSIIEQDEMFENLEKELFNQYDEEKK
ncbi:MAG: hypothetical protein U9O86_03435 [Campylobacterota bacterium]|nr:hypothetical protein [Campylobacterota bacterium]